MATTSWTQIVDKAVQTLVFNRYKEFLGITDINMDSVFYPPELALRNISEKRDEKITEFISIWRPNPPQYDWARQQTAIAREGMRMNYVASSAGGANKGIVSVKAVPCVFTYNFRLWSRDLDRLAQACDSYMKWIYDNPNMVIYFMGLYEMNMYLKFQDARDVTDYQIYEKGQHFIYEFPITVDGWVLTSFTTPTILKIIIDLYLREGQSPNYLDTFIDEYIINATV
jgi:hypothetical protein